MLASKAPNENDFFMYIPMQLRLCALHKDDKVASSRCLSMCSLTIIAITSTITASTTASASSFLLLSSFFG